MKRKRTRAKSCWHILGAAPILIAAVAVAQGQGRPVTRVAPQPSQGGLTAEEYLDRQAQLHEQLTAEMPDGTLDARIRADLTQQEQDDLATPPRTLPMRIGLVKSIPAVSLNTAHGVFQQTEDGGSVWAVTIQSPGAFRIRVHLKNFSLPVGAEMFIFTPEGDAQGPYVGTGPNGNNFWTHSVAGDIAVIQLRNPGQDRGNSSFVIDKIGHIGRPFPNPVPQGHNWSHGQCGNPSCVEDASCGGLGPAGPAADAVAKMEWIQGAFIFTCTGGLIADTDNSSQRNLFLTANHCLSKNNAAQNLETFFFYTTSSCNGNCPGNPTAHTIGSTVLKSGRKGDYTLLELSQDPPAGTTFLGFNNSPVAFNDGDDLYRISNPNFGPQVFSHHQVDANTGTCQGWPRGERIYSADHHGATDGGSSGAPVVNASSEIVGQLSGCCGFDCFDVCAGAPTNATVDGALAFYYDDVAEFLDPQGGGCSTNAECDDDQFCNGAETCVSGSCQGGSNPCQAGETCDEDNNQCIGCTGGQKGDPCTDDADCCSNKCRGRAGNKTCK